MRTPVTLGLLILSGLKVDFKQTPSKLLLTSGSGSFNISLFLSQIALFVSFAAAVG
jgi:hypothetical protein